VTAPLAKFSLSANVASGLLGANFLAAINSFLTGSSNSISRADIPIR
jgi:hypothetical protein